MAAARRIRRGGLGGCAPPFPALPPEAAYDWDAGAAAAAKRHTEAPRVPCSEDVQRLVEDVLRHRYAEELGGQRRGFGCFAPGLDPLGGPKLELRVDDLELRLQRLELQYTEFVGAAARSELRLQRFRAVTPPAPPGDALRRAPRPRSAWGARPGAAPPEAAPQEAGPPEARPRARSQQSVSPLTWRPQARWRPAAMQMPGPPASVGGKAYGPPIASAQGGAGRAWAEPGEHEDEAKSAKREEGGAPSRQPPAPAEESPSVAADKVAPPQREHAQARRGSDLRGGEAAAARPRTAPSRRGSDGGAPVEQPAPRRRTDPQASAHGGAAPVGERARSGSAPALPKQRKQSAQGPRPPRRPAPEARAPPPQPEERRREKQQKQPEPQRPEPQRPEPPPLLEPQPQQRQQPEPPQQPEPQPAEPQPPEPQQPEPQPAEPKDPKPPPQPEPQPQASEQPLADQVPSPQSGPEAEGLEVQRAEQLQQGDTEAQEERAPSAAENGPEVAAASTSQVAEPTGLPKTTPAMLATIFAELDHDNSGTIEKQELLKVLCTDEEKAKFFGFSSVVCVGDPSWKQAETLFRKMDRDGERQITWDDFAEFYKGLFAERETTSSHTPHPVVDEILALCGCAGSDITKFKLIEACRQEPRVAEFFGLPSNISPSHASWARAAEVFGKLDGDGDRVLSRAELIAFYEENGAGAAEQAATQPGDPTPQPPATEAGPAAAEEAPRLEPTAEPTEPSEPPAPEPPPPEPAAEAPAADAGEYSDFED